MFCRARATVLVGTNARIQSPRVRRAVSEARSKAGSKEPPTRRDERASRRSLDRCVFHTARATRRHARTSRSAFHMPRIVSLLVLLALVHAASAALGDAWPTVSAARRAIARLSGGATVGALCAVSNCERSGPVPSTPPGGKFARFGPYDTRLVYLEGEQTSAYGFPSAVVACPVLPLDVTRGDRREDRRGGEKHFSQIKKLLRKNAAGTLKFPGLAWSSGGAGSCLGTDGFANAADGFSETMAGDHRGYWLPDLLHHAASWGIVAACPALAPGIPVGDGSETRGAAKMLADLQPCLIHRGDDDGNTNASSNVLSGVKVDKRSLALAGYSLGGGRALRGAAGDRDGIVGAVVAAHAWGVPNNGFFAVDRVDVPALFLSATEDTNAPFRDSETTYVRATGPKIRAALRDQNHYTSPRFWAGATVAFVLSAFQAEPFAEHADRVVWGGGKQPGLANDPMLTWTRADCGWWRHDASRACAA